MHTRLRSSFAAFHVEEKKEKETEGEKVTQGRYRLIA